MESLREELANAGVDLHLASIKGPVLDSLQKIGFVDLIGEDHIHFNAQDAMVNLGYVQPNEDIGMRVAEAAALARRTGGG